MNKRISCDFAEISLATPEKFKIEEHRQKNDSEFSNFPTKLRKKMLWLP